MDGYRTERTLMGCAVGTDPSREGGGGGGGAPISVLKQIQYVLAVFSFETRTAM